LSNILSRIMIFVILISFILVGIPSNDSKVLAASNHVYDLYTYSLSPWGSETYKHYESTMWGDSCTQIENRWEPPWNPSLGIYDLNITPIANWGKWQVSNTFLSAKKTITVCGGSVGGGQVSYTYDTWERVRIPTKLSYVKTINEPTYNTYYDANQVIYTYLGDGVMYYFVYRGMNTPPSIKIDNQGQNFIVGDNVGDTFTITGKVADPDGDSVTVTATIGGVKKSMVITNSPMSFPVSSNWMLTWNSKLDGIPDGIYSNILVTADDGK